MDYWDFFIWALQKIGTRYLVMTLSAFLIFYVIFRRKLLLKKIQKKFPNKEDYLRDFGYSALSILIFGVVALLTFRVLKPYSQLYSEIVDHSTGYYLFSFFFLIFFHDAYFYAIHRLMHLPKIYRSVHLVHHKSTNPSPWTAYAFHPLEAVLEALVIPLMTFLIPVHGTVIGFLMLFQITYNVYGHLGWELWPKGFHRTWIGKYVNTSVAHNQHHEKFHGNYGLYTLIWDRVFGTVREDYDRAYESLQR